MAFVEPLSAFMFEFAEACTIAGVAQTGIFDNPYQAQFGMVSGSDPTLTILDASLGSAVLGSSVTVRSTSYTIAGIEPDGTGITVLQLESV